MFLKIFRKYVQRSLFLILPQVVSLILSLVTLPIILANLPIQEYGQWQFVIALQAWMLACTAENITSASKKGIAKGLNGTIIYSIIVRLKFTIPLSVVLLGISFVLFHTLDLEILSYFLAIISIYLSLGYVFERSFNEFFIAKQQFSQWCYWKVLISCITLPGSAIIAFYSNSVIYCFLFQLTITTVAGWLGFAFIVKKYHLIESYKKGEIDKTCVPYGIRLIPYALFFLTGSKAGQLLMGPVFGFANLAVFSVSMKLNQQAIGVVKITRQLFYAEFAGYTDFEKLKDKIHNYIIRILSLGSLITVILWIFGLFYLKIILPDTFQKAPLYFSILMFLIPPALIEVILHTVLEVQLHWEKITTIGIISTSLKILLIIVLSIAFDIVGICIAIVISSYCNAILYYFVTIRNLTFKLPLIANESN